MSKKILSVNDGKVIEHEVRSDADRNIEELYKALSSFMGVPSDKDPNNVFVTSLGALEYACAVANQIGVSRDVFLESVGNVWENVTTPKDRAVREQG